jgi:predicted AAA+ superfamily ATPase
VTYEARVVDDELNLLISGLPAVSIEGAKGVGKTATAQRPAASVVSLDRPGVRRVAGADPRALLGGERPVLLDEWQLVPSVWDYVRRAVDADRTAGQFILAGSALPPPEARLHSGAGRIVRLRMRPMTLPERGVAKTTVSLAALLEGGRGVIEGRSVLRLGDYAEEIVASGFPGIRHDSSALRGRMVGSYIEQITERDIPELGVDVRRPAELLAWLTAYAAATATTASATKILGSATPGQDQRPSKNTASAYRALLQRVWILDPLPAWIPQFNPLKQVGQAPKHHLADPALAARLLAATTQSLLRAEGPYEARTEDGLLAALFESLAAPTVCVFAQPLEARVYHLRTHRGEHEIDLIVERPDQRILALEIKLGATPAPRASKHLNLLESQIGDTLVDMAVITSGEFAPVGGRHSGHPTGASRPVTGAGDADGQVPCARRRGSRFKHGPTSRDGGNRQGPTGAPPPKSRRVTTD